VLLVHREVYVRSVTDLDGKPAPALEGKRPERLDMKEIEAPLTSPAWPMFHSYRHPGRWIVPYANDTSIGGERWYLDPREGRLLGYDGQSKLPLGSIGPDGFVPPDQQPQERFVGRLNFPTKPYQTGRSPYLILSSGVYSVDFAKRTLRTLFAPASGETVLWANRWQDGKQKPALVFLATNQSVHVTDETGKQVFSAPLAFDTTAYASLRFGRLDKPERFVVWYEPSWHLATGVGKTMPSYVLVYDADGKEIARQTVPPTPLPKSTYAQALFGLITAPAEAAVLVGTTQYLWSEAGSDGAREVTPLLFMLAYATQYFIPGLGWDRTTEIDQILLYVAFIILSAGLSALICFMLARRCAFSRARCVGWLLCGLAFGPVGILLMVALQQWPARLTCPQCNRLRVVTRDTCEHCGAAHAGPVLDGTEIFEPTVEAHEARESVLSV
jgi:hypothetical protein